MNKNYLLKNKVYLTFLLMFWLIMTFPNWNGNKTNQIGYAILSIKIKNKKFFPGGRFTKFAVSFKIQIINYKKDYLR